MTRNPSVMNDCDYYLTQTHGAIAATLHMVKWYRAFIRSPSERARDPHSQFPRLMTREEAQARLRGMVHRAISGKADPRELPRGRKDDYDYQLRLRRDFYRLRSIAQGTRVYQFESEECRQRFSHLLANPED